MQHYLWCTEEEEASLSSPSQEWRWYLWFMSLNGLPLIIPQVHWEGVRPKDYRQSQVLRKGIVYISASWKKWKLGEMFTGLEEFKGELTSRNRPLIIVGETLPSPPLPFFRNLNPKTGNWFDLRPNYQISNKITSSLLWEMPISKPSNTQKVVSKVVMSLRLYPTFKQIC